MSEQTYGGHTLAEIKAAAEAASAERKYGSSGLHGLETWARDGCRVERDLAAHIRDLQAIPAGVLAMAARIEELERDAARYRQLRRGQRWSVIDGIGKSLRADELDAAIDAMEQIKNREGV